MNGRPGHPALADEYLRVRKHSRRASEARRRLRRLIEAVESLDLRPGTAEVDEVLDQVRKAKLLTERWRKGHS